MEHSYLEGYATRFAKTVSDRFFVQKKYITGPDIVTFSPSSQVNFFILKTLFEQWEEELEQLKDNPYFDYRNNQVDQALKEFVNVLSRAIKVDREHFEPLVRQAVMLTLFLAADPLRFYLGELSDLEDEEVNPFLRKNLKYFKWHQDLISGVVDRAAIPQTREAISAAIRANYERLQEDLTPLESLVVSLDQVEPLDLEALQAEFFPAAGQSTGGEEQEETSSQASDTTAMVEEEEERTEAAASLEESPAAAPEESSTAASEEAPAAALPLRSYLDPIDPAQAWEACGQQLSGVVKPITPGGLSASIGVNQRYMFVGSLFKGDGQALNAALQALDRQDEWIDAVCMLNRDYIPQYDWPIPSDEVDEFMLLLFRRFYP
ncbi:hypothetical protein A3SI_05372 [Nitritalea halalkaliphila LW7]|uniref:Uncharacterized protein n=1 Tax=Nitritalea halalkaliphila LW7 TaxID=1189621 RepID=I5C7S5_9BACT|nr:hypothetical protein [Nitritalea halalkaliphila]EIM77877.1 hypothetical protein A3SI_05372 [Nitritalea halalkaliphila LW7]